MVDIYREVGKMRRYKKILAVILCGIMVCSGMNVTALAEDATEISVSEDASMDPDEGDGYSEDENAGIPENGTEESEDISETAPINNDVEVMSVSEESTGDEETAATPTIDVQRKEGDKDKWCYNEIVDRAAAYCFSPSITIQAGSGTIGSVTINGTEVTEAAGQVTYTINDLFENKSYQMNQKTRGYSILVKNSDGQQTSKTVYWHIYYGMAGENRSKTEIIEPATCSLPGTQVTVYYCPYCGDEVGRGGETEYASGGLGHHFDGEGEVYTDTYGSYRKQKCTVCGFQQTTLISTHMEGHTWGENITVAPKADNDTYAEGYTYRECTNCGFTEWVGDPTRPSEEVSCKHEFNANWGTVRATCVTPLYYTRTCTKCGYKEYWNKGGSLGQHTWLDSNWQVTKEATCGVAGSRTRKCTKCNATQTEEIPATGQHRYRSVITKEATCTEEGTMTYTCNVCGDTYTEAIAKKAHDYEEKIIKEATCESAGEKELTCKTCQDKKTETIEAKGHTPQVQNGDCTKATTCSVCGVVLSEGQVSHDFSGDVASSTASGHSMKCKNPGCEQVGPVEPHTGVDDGDCTTALYCDQCHALMRAAEKNHYRPTNGYKGSDMKPSKDYCVYYCKNEGCTQISAVFKHMSVYMSDSTGHWEKCERCKYEGEKTLHNFERRSDGTNHWEECMVCGYKRNSEPHKLSYTYDSAGHWMECSECGYIDEDSKGTHLPSADDDHDCMTPVACACGYEMIAATDGHVFDSDVWEHDDSQHWRVCTNPDCKVKVFAGSHTPGDEIRVNEVKPTCTEGGSYEAYIICTECKAELSRKTVTVPMTGHNWQVEENKAPSCTEDGYILYNCSYCGASKRETDDTMKTKGHQFGDWETVDTAGCEDSGVQERVCKACGEIETKGLNPNGHVWDTEYTVDQEATCTVEGSKSIHCKNCGVVKPDSSQVIPALGHDYKNYVYDEGSADCYKDGTETAICEHAGCDMTHTRTKAGTKLEHKMSEWQETEAATCLSAGRKSRGCILCGMIETEEISALGHDYVVGYHEDPTCQLPGRTSQACTRCGDLQIEEIPMLDHQWTEWGPEKNAACLEAGSESRYCTSCGTPEYRNTPALGHSWEYEFRWSEDHRSVYLVRTCKHDPQHTEYYNDVTVTVSELPATCTETGTRTFTASIPLDGLEYKDQYEEPIPALGHLFIHYVENGDGTETSKCERCDEVHSRTSSLIITDKTDSAVTVDLSGLDLNSILGDIRPEEHNIEIVLEQSTAPETDIAKVSAKLSEQYEILKAVQLNMHLNVDGKFFKELTDNFGSIGLNFYAGKEYAGRKVTIYQLHGDSILEYPDLAISQDGYVAIRISKLSTFVIALQKEEPEKSTVVQQDKESSPKTDDHSQVEILFVLMLVSILGMAGTAVYRRKRRMK